MGRWVGGVAFLVVFGFDALVCGEGRWWLNGDGELDRLEGELWKFHEVDSMSRVLT